MITTKASKKNHARQLLRPVEPAKSPFLEHVKELRRRLFYVSFSVCAWAIGAYFIQQYIVAALLKPAHNQQFIYTSVGGGIDFLFRVCIYTGVVFSIPVIVYHSLMYVEPLIKRGAMRFIGWCSVVSGVLALCGVAFGYFFGLPSALQFLLHQFSTDQIQPLLTIQSYMSFVTLYLFGAALLFQLPLVLVMINRIKPLSPRKLLGYERWVILIAFVLGGIMNPSPRVQDQLMLAVPIVAAYQIGLIIIWQLNRRGRRSRRFDKLLEQDAKLRIERQTKARQPLVVPEPAENMINSELLTTPDLQALQVKTTSRQTVRASYFNDFAGQRRIYTETSANQTDTEPGAA